MILKVIILAAIVFHLALWYSVTKKMYSSKINLSPEEKFSHCIAMLFNPIIGPVVEYRNLKKENPDFK